MTNKRKNGTGIDEHLTKVEKLIAKKDFVIVQNEFHISIKAGQDLKDVPKVYIPNLITEGVL